MLGSFFAATYNTHRDSLRGPPSTIPSLIILPAPTDAFAGIQMTHDDFSWWAGASLHARVGNLWFVIAVCQYRLKVFFTKETRCFVFENATCKQAGTSMAHMSLPQTSVLFQRLV